jgi:FKBP-type peptidyl-prolyl cis-trans isomerase FkpA
MKNQTIAAAVASMLPFMLSSCDKLDKGRKQTAEGLQYEMIVDENGRKAKIGDYLTLHLVVSTEKDSVLNSTYKNGGPLTAKLLLPPMKGGLEDGFQLMSAGDSANFYISIDSLMKGQPEESRPKFFPKGSFVKYRVKMLKVLDSAAAVGEQQKSMDNYGKKKGLSLMKTASGLRYAITTLGSGPKANPGDTIQVHYAGTLLESGKEFDNSRKRGEEPFTFPVGMGMVIPGWDEGLLLLPAGSKATLVIPPGLAYGDRGAPGSPIGANAALVFDVEVMKIIPAKAGTMKMPSEMEIAPSPADIKRGK